MCGIVAYCGPERRSLPQELVRHLAALEYRGYDSAGVVSLARSGMTVVKTIGPVAKLAARLRTMKVSEARVGMAHTRWATHGAVSVDNAHPVLSASGKLALVMNGVVENDLALRRVLQSGGQEPESDSDTATLVAAIEAQMTLQASADVRAACAAVLGAVNGRVAICLVHRDYPGLLVAARRGSPLFVGRAGRSLWVASDPVAFPETVDAVFEIADGETVAFADGEVAAAMESKLRAAPKARRLDAAAPQKPSGLGTYFEQEILEQEATVSRAVASGLELESLPSADANAWNRVLFLGCGSAHHACLAGKLAVERWARLPAEVVLASEFLCTEPVIDAQTLVIAVSQSGETADTVAAAERAIAGGGAIIAVTNVAGSSLDRLACQTVFLEVGREVSVASTKAYTGMLVRLTLLAAELGVRRKALAPSAFRAIAAEARNLGGAVRAAQGARTAVQAAVARWRDKREFMFLGRGFDHVSALEGALKLRELSYRHAHGIAAGELKHGTIALIEGGYPVVAISLDRRAHEKTMTAMREVKTRGADLLAIVAADDADAPAASSQLIALPRVNDAWAPIVAAVPLQWLAFYLAAELGRDVDRPRNLAKSVTVV